MMTFEVSLLNKRTLEGKRVFVQAGSRSEAFKNATGIQAFPRMWATITAEVQAFSKNGRFQHKGLAKRG